MKNKSHVIVIVLTFLLAALSVAAGIPKVMQMPQELGFLQPLGFSPIAISVLGVVQVLGGILLLLRKTRLPGATLAGLAFLISSVAIFVGGNMQFGLISLLPFAVSLFVAYTSMRSREPTDDRYVYKMPQLRR